jgi:homoserine dehydrogenase
MSKLAGKEVLGIGLLGLGTVGSAVYKMLKDREDEFAARFGVRIEVRKVLVKHFEKARTAKVPFEDLTVDYDQLLKDERIDIIVEVMGGVNPAFEYISKALKAGKSVVTANKHLLAVKGAELEALSKEHNVPLRFEASVGGIIPVVHAFGNGTHSMDILKVRGILNGTSNYILSSMRFDGVEYEDALAQAQAKGYAEPDPTLDVSGQDTAHKLCVLCRLAFGKFLPLEKVSVSGIGPQTKPMIESAKHMGHNVKLVGTLIMNKAKFGDLPKAIVAPEDLVKEDPMFGINGSMNCIVIETKDTGTITLSGRGAGGGETATSVVSDILALAVKGKECSVFCY